MNETEIKFLSSEVAEIKKVVEEIRSCLLGNMTGNAGLIASHNKAKDDIDKCKSDVRALKISVVELKTDKVRC